MLVIVLGTTVGGPGWPRRVSHDGFGGCSCINIMATATSHGSHPTPSSSYCTATMNRSGFQPIDKIHLAFHAYHVAAHDHNQSVESYHFCAGGNDGVFQCLIYDSAEKDAKLIGIEYLIPEEVFATLDDEEKRLWHSHKFEVGTGLLLPLHPNGEHTTKHSGGLLAANADVEKQQMQMIYKMYGKIMCVSTLRAIPLASTADRSSI